jgi:hypothetical protein
MIVFTSSKFIEKLRWLVNDVPNYYHSEAGTWCNYNRNNNKFMMDCVVSIKGLLWGFSADKNKPHGGGIYGSNGVADFTPDGGLNYCTNVSRDFNNITPGEYLCMKDTGYGHAGIYLGNGKVFECTVAWGTNKCIISEIDTSGNRFYNGVRNLKWTYHGKLKYIDYSKENDSNQTLKYKVGDVVTINGVYVSSTSTEKLKPAITKGTITRVIEGARNPYLLDNGNIGWVNDECIVNTTNIQYKYVTNCYWLNLRTSPSYGNNIYTSVKVGTKVEYLGIVNGWAKIKYQNKILYCGNSYLR